MPHETHHRWNAIATIIALAVLLAAGAKVKAFLQTDTVPEEGTRAIAQAETPAPQRESTAPEHAPAAGEASEHEAGPWDTFFQWTNFLLIGGAIWYLGKKYGAPLLSQRARAIQEDMERSARAVAEASQRLTQIEEKLQRLGEEIEQLRQTAFQEAAAEQARIEAMAQSESGKIVQTAEQEIATAAKAARRELQRYTAELAVGLAEKRIRETISLDAEKRILRSFVNDLTDGAGRESKR